MLNKVGKVSSRVFSIKLGKPGKESDEPSSKTEEGKGRQLATQSSSEVEVSLEERTSNLSRQSYTVDENAPITGRSTRRTGSWADLAGTVPRVSSWTNFAGSLFPSTDVDQVIPVSENMERVERQINDPNAVQQFIIQTLSLKGAFATLTRFCTTVSKIEATLDAAEQRKKTNSVIDLFFKDKSLSNISALLDKNVVDDVLRKRDMNSLTIAKRFCLKMLSEDVRVLQILDKMEATEHGAALKPLSVDESTEH